MQVRGLVFDGPGTPLSLEQLDLGAPQPGEVLVRWTASGVCRSDLHVVDGDWSRPTPVVLGHEGAGTVEALGEGVDDLAVGDSVVLTWLAPCGSCRSCAAGRSWLCTGSSSGTHLLPDGTARLTRADGTAVRQYLGLGTMSEASVVTRPAVVRVPAEVPPAVAALIGCGVATGWGAVVNTAAVSAGDVVVVVGCGGVGLAAVMAAADLGAEVVAVDLVPAKLEAATRAGASRTLSGDDWAAHLGHVDVGLDCIGSPEVATALLSAVVPGGQVLLVGMTAQGVTVPVDGYALPDRGVRLVGCCYGSTVAARDFPLVAQHYLDGRLPLDDLVDRRIPLAEVDDAFARMRRGEGLRAVVDPLL